MEPSRPPNKFFIKFKNFFHQPVDTKESFLAVLKEAESSSVLDVYTRSVMEGALQSYQMKVRDVMVPKGRMVTLDEDADTQSMLETVIQSGHSRFPLIDTTINEVVGILLAKDLLAHLVEQKDQDFDCKDYLRRSIIVPESMSLGALLRDFQQTRMHMAVVVDEFNNITGLITIEDVLEQIVGEIEDEHDVEEENIVDYGKGRFLLKATTPLSEFNAYFNTSLEAPDVDSIGGYVINGFTYLPEQMSEIVLDGFRFKVLKVDTRRLSLLEVTHN